MERIVEKSTKEKIVSASVLVFAILILAFSIIPYAGFFAWSPAIGVFVLAWLAFRVFKQQNKSHLIPRASMVICVVAIASAMFQYPKMKPALENYSKIKKIKKGVFLYIFSEYVFKSKDEIASNNVTLVEGTETITNPANTDEEPAKEQFIERGERMKTSYFSIVDNLRMRSSPDLKGKVLGEINFGARVAFLENSIKKDTIQIAGREAIDHWKKIKYRQNNFVEPIEAWVFGGGLVQSSRMETRIGDALYGTLYEYEDREIENTTGLEAESGYFYNGIVMYVEEEDFIKQGRFYLEGRSKKGICDMPEHQFIDRLTGTFERDQLHGKFEKHHVLCEGSYRYTIDYDHGVCTRNSIRHQAEGDVNEKENTNPEDCSFAFMRSSL